MKKINLLIVAILATIIGFTSCNNYDDPIINAPSEITIDISSLDVNVLTAEISIDKKDVFSEVYVTSTFNDETTSKYSVDDFAGKTTYSLNCTGANLSATKDLKNITIYVKTANNKESSETIGVIIDASAVYNNPVITAPTKITIDLADLSSKVLEGKVTSDEGDNLEIVTFTSTFANIGTRTLEVTNFSTNSYYFSFNGEDLDAKEGFVNIVIKATTVHGKVATQEVEVELILVPVPTTLSEADFSWERIGITPGTDLEQFGLKWEDGMHDDSKCHIQPLEGVKLIEIIEEEIPGLNVYDAIITLEALKQRVDAVTTGLDEFNKISSAIDNDYDYLLATQVGENYYLIHITKATVVNGLTGTKVTITGKYKY